MSSGSPSRALDQLAQPIDFHRVHGDWIVVACVVEEAVGELRALAGRDQRRGGLDRAPFDRGEQLPLHRPVGRHHGVRQLNGCHDDVERRQVGHVRVGDRHRDGAELGGDLRFGPRQGHPLALERIARPEVSLLPGHEGAAPERPVGDDRRRHEQVPSSNSVAACRSDPSASESARRPATGRGPTCRSDP